MKPNTLLKVISIVYIIVSALGILLGLLVAVLGGAVLGAASESLGVGLAVGGSLGVLLLAGSALSLAAGIVGVKGKFRGAKVLGIIILVLGVIGSVSSLFTTLDLKSAIVPALLELILPVLYVIGAFKGPAAE